MRFDIKELQKALIGVTKNGGPTEVDIQVDPMNRLVITYVDTMGGDLCTVTLYNTDIQKMATITRTTRL